jgi:hypothetical protein
MRAIWRRAISKLKHSLQKKCENGEQVQEWHVAGYSNGVMNNEFFFYGYHSNNKRKTGSRG